MCLRGIEYYSHEQYIHGRLDLPSPSHLASGTARPRLGYNTPLPLWHQLASLLFIPPVFIIYPISLHNYNRNLTMVDQGPPMDAQCPSWAAALGYMGVASAVCLSNWGSAVSPRVKPLYLR